METYQWVLTTIGVIVLACLILLTFAPRHVVGYYVSDGGLTRGSLYLGVDIEWYTDQYVPLVGINLNEAAELVKQLNATINERTTQ